MEQGVLPGITVNIFLSTCEHFTLPFKKNIGSVWLCNLVFFCFCFYQDTKFHSLEPGDPW